VTASPDYSPSLHHLQAANAFRLSDFDPTASGGARGGDLDVEKSKLPTCLISAICTASIVKSGRPRWSRSSGSKTQYGAADMLKLVSEAAVVITVSVGVIGWCCWNQATYDGPWHNYSFSTLWPA